MESILEERARIPKLVIKPRKGLFQLDLGSLWQYRDLLYFLIWRDIKVRYKQTLIGILWSILQPLMTMVVFTVVFSMLARIPSDGFPYPIFVLTGLLPWTYFSQALGRTGGSLVGNATLITKVYFPRLMIPLSAVVVPAVDLLMSFLILLGFIVYYRITPTWAILALPALILLSLLTALAVGFWLSALHVKYRDVGYITPFLIQVWMYASPVAYPVSLIPEKWRTLYGLNPMVGVIEGFRWALLGKDSPEFGAMAVSASIIIIIAMGGIIYFKNTEKTFADLV
jgi:lipopolysaccharide transport system permease protein